jgi:hypothetical protein
MREGGKDKNLKGSYKILRMDENLRRMDVEYTDGPSAGMIQNLSIAEMARHVYLERQREFRDEFRTHEIHMRGRNRSFTLGYLASKGVLQCMVIPSEMPWFRVTYARITGESVDEHLNDNVWIRQDDGGSWFKARFPEPPPEILAMMEIEEDGVVPKTYNAKRFGMEMTSKPFFFSLLKAGFKLGRNEGNIPAIRQAVNDKAAFDEGVDYQPPALAA